MVDFQVTIRLYSPSTGGVYKVDCSLFIHLHSSTSTKILRCVDWMILKTQPFEWWKPLQPNNGSDTPKVIKSIPITSHFRQLGNTLSQSALVLSAMESFTGTTKRTRVPATLRIKEISLILQQLPHKDQLNLPFISITAVNGLLS